jgi:antitoxin component of MazEF toxin-antitoxin module
MPKVEERKVQQLRGSSYVLTLPKEWVEASGLRKGMGVTVVYEPGILRVFPTGRRKLELSVTVETSAAEQIGEIVTACYELGCSSLTISCRSGISDELRGVLKRLREELQGVFVSQQSEGVVSVEISEVPFKSLEQAVSILLQALVRTLRFAESGGPKVKREDLEEMLRDSRGYGSALVRYVSSLLSSPDGTVPHYAMPLIVEVAVRMRDLVSTVGELLTSGSWSQESLASLERLLENLSLHVADLLSAGAQEGLMGLRREVRELRKSGAHPEVDGVLLELERLLSSLIRLNALIVAGT